MEHEVKVILEDSKKLTRKVVSFTVRDIPMRVHKKIQDYRLKIIHERKRPFSLNQAYKEFLIEKTK